MIALIQRVSSAKVEIDDKTIANIEQGIVALVAVQQHDTSDTIQRICTRLVNYRIFPDQDDKMNLSLLDVNAGLILVPQFTLIAQTNKGNRPSFGNNVTANQGRQGFQQLVSCAKQYVATVQTGEFGADMQVSLTNDGPVTFWLEV